MAFQLQSKKCSHVLLWATILCLGAADSLAQDLSKAQVLVYNDAQVQSSILEAGELEADRIFRQAGVRLNWLNCSAQHSNLPGEHCRVVSGARQFVLRVLPKGKISSDLVFGEAFLGENGKGMYADVFFDRIRSAHDVDGTSMPRLFGAVTAHELGHLLLGFNAHSWLGIMMPVWDAGCVRRMNMGTLLFTGDQARHMQSTLEKSTLLNSHQLIAIK
jgi:hypothetical protein